jgi:hypothetical protein
MAIHFNFIVSDEDAENIMSALQSEIGNDLEIILDLMSQERSYAPFENVTNAIAYYKRDILYLTELKHKMKNTHVIEDARIEELQ